MDDDLDAFFAAARHAPPRPSVGLQRRVLADAEMALAAPITPPMAPKPAVHRPASLWARLADAFGGGGALAGMMTATVAGLYIGYVQPSEAGILVSALGGSLEELDLMPGIDALLEEAP